MLSLIEQARKTIVYGKKSEKPDCLFLMGLPGSGKSYVSKYLHERYGYTVLSGENITYAIFGTTQCGTGQYSEAYGILYILLPELLNQGHSVVIDGTNLRYIHRQQIYKAVEAEIKVSGIYLRVDETVAKERIRQRGESSENPADITSGCSDETFEDFYQSVETPREDENIHSFTSDTNLFDSIDRLLSNPHGV